MAPKNKVLKNKVPSKKNAHANKASRRNMDPMDTAPVDIAASMPFRFVDLPAENRNQIYALVLAEDKVYDLATFPTPAIARVSRQLRHESLPVLFAEAQFEVFLSSNFADRNCARIGEQPVAGAKGRQTKAGTLRVNATVKQFVRKAGANALFKKIEFKICWHIRKVSPEYRAAFPNFQKNYLTTTLSVTKDNTGLNTSTSNGRMHPANMTYLGFEEIDVKTVTDLAETTVQRLGNREGFIGFSLADLEMIARTFRFKAQAES